MIIDLKALSFVVSFADDTFSSSPKVLSGYAVVSITVWRSHSVLASQPASRDEC